jgi:threonyl-tRNA synthetase
VSLDDTSETVGKKIRSAEMKKVPYILVVGEKEMAAKTVAVRMLHDKNIETMKWLKFIEQIGKQGRDE